MSVRNTVKSIQDIMRQDTGVDGDAQRISQLCWMFFLKIMDDQDQELELLTPGYGSPIPPAGHRELGGEAHPCGNAPHGRARHDPRELFPTAINTVPVAINQDMKAVRPFREDLADFLLLLLKAMKPDVLPLVKRSTHGYVQASDRRTLCPAAPDSPACRTAAHHGQGRRVDGPMRPPRSPTLSRTNRKQPFARGRSAQDPGRNRRRHSRARSSLKPRTRDATSARIRAALRPGLSPLPHQILLRTPNHCSAS